MNRTVLLCGLCAVVAGTALAAEPPRKVITLCGEKMELMTPDEVRARGFPWTDVPDDRNAATEYLKGANALYALKHSPEAEQQRDHALRHAWDDRMKALAAWLDAAKPALDHYRKGAARKLCQFPYPRTAMLAGMLLPDLSKARSACRLLAAHARRCEARKQFRRAVDDYLAIARIGCHYGNGRTLIGHLVGIACLRIGLDNAFRGILRCDYPPKELRRLLRGLTALRGRLPDFVRAMQSEKAFGLGTVDDLMRLGPRSIQVFGLRGEDEEPPEPLPSPLQARLLRILLPDRTVKKDMAAYYDRAIAAARKPYDPKVQEKLGWPLYKKPWNILGSLLLPALGRARTENVRCRAAFDAFRIALAVRLFELERGAYPDNLRWLLQDGQLKTLPPDPFGGKRFRYKVEAGHFTVWSIGENMKDDGGKVAWDPETNQTPDVGYTSKLPPVKLFEPKKQER